ncbi:hypothetical protein V3C99_013629 [Haemonchus contortus]
MAEALECLRLLRKLDDDMTPERIAYGVVVVSITLTAFLLNSLLIAVILKTDIIPRCLRLYLTSAATAGIAGAVTNALTLIPAILFRIQLMDPINIYLSTPDTLGYLTLMLTTTIIAVDRFIFFYMNEAHSRLKAAYYPLPIFASMPWILAIITTICMNMSGCYKRTDPFALSYTYDCSDCSFYSTLLSYAAYVFPGVNFVLYLFIYLRILKMRSHLRKHGQWLTGSTLNKAEIKVRENETDQSVNSNLSEVD